jgi:phenylpropionate dioxygenase-like ring-hydroxylating dioxygenase large terminal subunit
MFPTSPDPLSQCLWTQNWHLLAHRSEIEVARDFLRFDVAGREVVLHHDGTSVMAFDNRCPHRGTRIFDNDYGRERFVCRYHGWSYANGRVFVADKKALAHCPIDQIMLNQLKVSWIGDFVFVAENPLQSLDAQLAGLAPILEAVSLGIDQRWDYNRYNYEADWRIVLENALEPYHLSSIHPDTLNTLNLQTGTNEYFGSNSVWSAPIGDNRVEKRLRSLNRLFNLPHQFEGYQSIYIFPFTMISSTFGFSQSIQHFLPTQSPERTAFTSRLFSGRLQEGVKPEIVTSLMASSATMNRAVFEEDHAICKRVPFDSWSMEPPRFWAASEEKLLHFRHSYRVAAALDAGSSLAGAANTERPAGTAR